MQKLPFHKTKIVCTIGPASDSYAMIEQMIEAGMNIARLNFSHGDFSGHGEVIGKVRAAAAKLDRRVAIMADLPGPKLRIGDLAEEVVTLIANTPFTLTVEDGIGSRDRVAVSMKQLPGVVRKGDIVFLNDGQIQLRVEEATGSDILCTVVVGGQLRARKGLNIPGIDLGISAFTERDRECMKFALENGVDAISQSFVSNAKDIEDVRRAAHELGFAPFIIAKIERAEALDNIDAILAAADGIMVARGDLGVEIPIERIAVVQKDLTARANRIGRPVITATQMLESMTRNRRPSRAEATDVANAILDGTDCVMLSEESATGDYPLEAVGMLHRIAAATEPHRQQHHYVDLAKSLPSEKRSRGVDVITLTIENLLAGLDSPAAILSPTASGYTARSLARFRLPVWVLAVSGSDKVCQELLFSYGVYPVQEDEHPENWTHYAREFAAALNLSGSCIIQTEGPSREHPQINYRIELIDIER